MKTLEEKNRMIAEFMGVEFTKIGERLMASPVPNEIGSCWEENMKYHTSYDWLMPVVEKIESLGHMTHLLSDKVNGEMQYNFIIHKSEGEYGALFSRTKNDKKEVIHLTAVKFIEWYNEQ